MRTCFLLLFLHWAIAVQSQTTDSIHYQWRTFGYIYYQPKGKRIRAQELKNMLLNNETSKQYYIACRKNNLAANIIGLGAAGFILYGMQRKLEQQYTGRINPYTVLGVALIPFNLIYFFKSLRIKHKAVKAYNKAINY